MWNFRAFVELQTTSFTHFLFNFNLQTMCEHVYEDCWKLELNDERALAGSQKLQGNQACQYN
ncbi:unnamed protein product [Tenebrio molitor]|nr:unnamed protein product [Tenebrio molitor]